MAVGLGSISAVTSICNEVLFNPYPFPDLDRFLIVQAVTERSNGRFGLSRPDFEDLRNLSSQFDEIAAMAVVQLNLIEGDQATAVTAARTTTNLFQMIGARPLEGRLFQPSDSLHEGSTVVLLGEDVWRSHFNADSEVLGRVIDLNGRGYEVIGIVPSSHRFPDQAEIWVPMAKEVHETERQQRGLLALGRLGPSSNRDTAEAELGLIAQQLEQDHPGTNETWSFALSSLSEFRIGPFKKTVGLLAAIVVLILIIACVNVGSLLLERVSSQDREFAVRYSLGSSQWNISRMVLAESLLLSFLGGVVGLAFAYTFLRLILTSLPPEYIANLNFGLDPAVFLITALSTVVAAILAGVLPVLRVSQLDLNTCLKEGGGQSVRFYRQRARRILIVGEIALSFVLLIAAGLMVRSFLNLQAVNPGHRLEGVLAVDLVLPSNPYSAADLRKSYYQDLLQRVGEVPGVESVAAGSFLPFASWGRSYLKDESGVRGAEFLAGVQRVSGNYFETLGIPVLLGETFSSFDREDTKQVAVINQGLASRLWPGENPIEKLLWVASDEVWRTVIGTVGDIQRVGLGGNSQYDIYLPYSQASGGRMILFAAANNAEPSLLLLLRQTIREVDPNVAIKRALGLDSALADLVAPQRTISLMILIFGLSALILAIVGIYGFVSFQVVQRRREIGIRIALGGTTQQVTWLVVRKMIILAGAGIGIGLLGGVLVSQLMQSMLFQTSGLDPVTFLAVVVLFLLTVFVASYIPASRAARVSPALALRSE